MSIGARESGVPARQGPYADGPRLLADVGGTNARFALETAPGSIGLIRAYACADFPGLAEVVKQYLLDAKASGVKHAAVAIANPVDGDQVHMTNHDWAFSIEATRRAAGFDTLLVVNDFTALATALPGLSASQCAQVGGGARRPGSVIGLVGPGTGLGVSGLVPVRDAARERWIALGSEGGHASFAPTDAREDQVLAYARKAWQHVSFERVVSGPGIELIYQALAQARAPQAAASLDAAAVVLRAQQGDALAAEALDCFCGILGGFAGNVAVTLGAQGGMFIGGGIVPRLGETFARSPFRRRFEAKGRFEGYLKRIPTYVITAEYPAFLGVSAMLAEQLPGAR